MAQQLRTLVAYFLEDQSSFPSTQIVQPSPASGDLKFFSTHAYIWYAQINRHDKQTYT